MPLKEAVAISRIRPGLELPAVVYRCVEYLEAKVNPFSVLKLTSVKLTPRFHFSFYRTLNTKKVSSDYPGRRT